MSAHEVTRAAAHEVTPLHVQLTVVDRLLQAESSNAQQLEGPRILHEQDGSVDGIAITDEVIVGRGENASKRIDDPDLSREHFRIERREDDWFLHDLGSTNGTYVNASRVEHRALVPGDLIYVGQQVFLFMD